MKRTVNAPDDEPKAKERLKPSEGEHQFQIVDVITHEDQLGTLFNLDEDTVMVKCEVSVGDEIGREILNRCNINDQSDSFWATRAMLKAIGLDYKGVIEIDTDAWIGRQFICEVKYNQSKDGTKTYANLSKYNYEKQVEQFGGATKPETVNWD